MAFDIRQIQKSKAGLEIPSSSPAFQWLNFLGKEMHLFGSVLNDKKKEGFYTELSVLLSSGIDLRTSLEIIVEEQSNETLRSIFKGIYDRVIEGKSLSEAERLSGKFTLYEYFSIRIGEESGCLKEVLGELTDYYGKKIRQRRQLSGTLTYPLLVMVTAFIAVLFMLNYIVPMFSEVFKRFQGELPPITRFIISLSESFSVYATAFFAVVVAAIVTSLLVRKNPQFRRITSQLMLGTPTIGKIVNKVYMARFCQNMALLLGSKTPLLKSLGMVRNMIGFYPYEKALETIESDVLHGMLLNQSMQKFKFFDKRLLALTRVAEEVNQLDNIFGKLSVQYSEELEHEINIIGNILEPALIIFVGALVAIILISMYLPLFQLSSSIA